MLDVKKLRAWAGLSGADFANKINVKQPLIAGYESGKVMPPPRVISAMIDKFTPVVLFLGDCPQSRIVASVMVMAGQVDCIADTANIDQHLKSGLRIIVITDDKEPFLQQIADAQVESGLPNIPVRGINIEDDRIATFD